MASGDEFDMSARTDPPDYVLLSLVGILTVFGLVALSSASSVVSYEKFGSSFYLVRHQLIFGVLPGLALFFLGLHLPYRRVRQMAVLLLAVAVLLLILVLIPGVGRKLGGSRSWFTIGAISFQPAEFVKLAVILYLAAWFESRRERVGEFKPGFLPFALTVGVIGFLIMLQPDVGTLAITGALALFMAYVGGMRLTHLAGAVAVGLLLLFILVKVAPYRTARLAAFVNPELDPQGVGYHINQALIAVGSGGMFGAGLGHSRQKFRYLPEATGDSIFPIIAEELGFIISAGFIVLIIVILWRMFRIARDAPDLFARYTVAGIAGWLGIQSFVNISSMLGVLPLTGLPLPFVSYGGTALAMEMLAIGIVGSISRHAK